MKRTIKSFAAAAAFYGLGAIFAAEADAQQVAQGHRLYSSAGTEAALGGVIAPKLPEWAGGDVILVRQDDLRFDADEISSLNFILNMAQRNKVVGASLLERAITPYFSRYLNSFPELAERDIASSIPLQSREAIAWFLAWRAGGARGFLPREGGGNRYCVIALPPLYDAQNATDIVSRMTGIDMEELENIPGTAKDWLILVMAHEAGHCQQDLNENDGRPDANRRIAFETMADQRAFAAYFDALTKGEASSFHAPGVYASVRAIRAIAVRDSDHATHLNLDTAGQGAVNIGHWKYPVSEEDLAEIYRKIDERIARDYNTDASEAKAIAARFPDRLYKAVEDMNREDAFAGNARAQEMVTYFLIAARIHAPKYFGLAPAFR